jgi:hypothetical protein
MSADHKNKLKSSEEQGNRFGRPAGEKSVYFDLAKNPTGAANLFV